MKEVKRQQEEKAAAEQITGQMTINEVCDPVDDTILKSEKTIEPSQETENEEQEKTPDVPVHMNNMEKTKPEKPVEIEKQENGVADQQQRTGKIDENRIESVEIRVGTEKNEGKELAQKWNISAFPTYLILNPQGEVVYTSRGYIPVEELIKRMNEGLEQWKNNIKTGK